MNSHLKYIQYFFLQENESDFAIPSWVIEIMRSNCRGGRREKGLLNHILEVLEPIRGKIYMFLRVFKGQPGKRKNKFKFCWIHGKMLVHLQMDG